MRALFIKPRWNYPIDREDSTYNRIWPPLSLINCAGYLIRRGYKADVLDAHALRLADSSVLQNLKNYDKIFITSSDIDRWQCPNLDISSFIHIAEAAAKLHKEVYIIGYHCTKDPIGLLKLTGAKGAIRHEPEETVEEICQNKDLAGIYGLTFADENCAYINNPNRPPLDLSKMPAPAFGLLDYKKYNYELLGSRFALFESSRGCLSNCVFCDRTMYAAGIRRKLLSQVRLELEEALNKRDVKNGYFIDLDFCGDEENVEGICDYLIEMKTGFKWACQSRALFIRQNLLKKMYLAGCRLIHFGVETGSERLRNTINKNLSNRSIFNSLSLARSVGIKTMCFIMLNLPGETDSDILETIKFVKSSEFDYLSVHLTTDYSTLGKACIPAKYKSLAKKMLLSFYLRPRFIVSELKNEGVYRSLQKAKFFLSYLIKR